MNLLLAFGEWSSISLRLSSSAAFVATSTLNNKRLIGELVKI